jgi:hypothetical protein
MAVYTGAGIDLPFTASGDLSSKQFYWVEPSATEKNVSLATGASGPAPLGILQNDPTSGLEASVRIFGSSIAMADAGTSIGYGDFVTSGSDGQTVVTTGSALHGIALEALSSGSGIKIEVLVLPAHLNTQDNVP